MRTFKTEGIILKRTNFGEADRILTIFTRRFGRIHVRAPGIRRTKSRKSAHLELFNLSSIFLVQGKNMDIVTEAETLETFNFLKKDLQKVGIAYYFCELADNLCPERQENREVFEILMEELKKLNQSNISVLGNISDEFANKVLWSLGYLQKDRSLKGEELNRFIEEILEKKLKSRRLLIKL